MICLAGCDKTIPGVTMALPRLNAVSVQHNVMATGILYKKASIWLTCNLKMLNPVQQELWQVLPQIDTLKAFRLHTTMSN